MSHKLNISGKFIYLLLLLAILLVSLNGNSVLAQAQDPSDRTTTVKIESRLYEWRLVYWSDKTTACDLLIDHEGNPTSDEIIQKCSQQVFNIWISTPACEHADSANSHQCIGLFLQYITSTSVNREMVVDIPLPSVSISLSGCEYRDDLDYCSGTPSLTFTGLEPLPKEKIIAIRGEVDGKVLSCKSESCIIPLPATDYEGIAISFKADSSNGDSSPDYEAYARVIPVPSRSDTYYVDVVSSQWEGRPAPPCSSIWQVFPESNNPSDWLLTPHNAADLESAHKLYFLSAALIKHGLVDASACENYGLAAESTANECGVAAAAIEAEKWQNQFNETILADAQTANVPATLMKNLIIRESQFWPGVYPGDVERGLAQITENGADTLFLWNKPFYDSFCPVVFVTPVCAKGYATLSKDKQAILKGALLQRVNATCPECLSGMDLSKGDYAIGVLSEALIANCSQVDRMITNITEQSPREVSTYTDLWRFTLANYNVGAGCLGNAMTRTWNDKSPMDWQHVAANFDPACQGAVDYIIDISDGMTDAILVYSTMLPTSTATPLQSATPTKTASPTTTLTPTATFTPSQTPSPTETPTVTPTPTNTEEGDD